MGHIRLEIKTVRDNTWQVPRLVGTEDSAAAAATAIAVMRMMMTAVATAESYSNILSPLRMSSVKWGIIKSCVQ